MITLSQALIDLGGTVAVESLELLLIVPSLSWRALLDLAWINVLTNPLGHLALAAGAGFWGTEVSVVLVEICLLRLLLFRSWTRAAAVGALCNGATIILSLVGLPWGGA